MDRAQKQEMVTLLNGIFKDAGAIVVTHYTGLNVAEMSDLRRQMGDVDAKVKVVKNRLAKLALDGAPCSEIADLFSGPTAIAYSDDPVAAPKAAVNFANGNDKLVILGGAMGETVLDKNGVEALAKTPSMDELRAKLLGMISTPATRIAGVLQAPGGQVARVLGAYAAKDEAA